MSQTTVRWFGLICMLAGYICGCVLGWEAFVWFSLAILSAGIVQTLIDKGVI